MKTLKEIKQDVAYNAGYENIKHENDGSAWCTLMNEITGDTSLIEFYFNQVAKLYAEQAIDAVCEHLKDYEHEEVDYSRKTPKTEDMLAIGYYGDGRDGDVMVWIDKQSILKIKEELK